MVSIFSFLAWFVSYAKFYHHAQLYILNSFIMVSNSFSFLANSLMSSMYVRWLIFACDFQSFYPVVHFLSMCLRGTILLQIVMVIAHPPGIFVSGTLLSFFLLMSIPLLIFWWFYDFLSYLEKVYYQVLGAHIINLFVVNPHHDHLFPSRFTLVEDVFDQYIRIHISLWLLCGILSFIQGTVHGLSYLPDPSARAGYGTRSIFKRSLTGFEFKVFLLLD